MSSKQQSAAGGADSTASSSGKGSSDGGIDVNGAGENVGTVAGVPGVKENSGVKRGRGRPKKQQPSGASIDGSKVAGTTKQTSRSASLPPSKPTPATDSRKGSKPAERVFRKVTETPDDGEQEKGGEGAQETTAEVVDAVTPKRRGRPKKNSTSSSAAAATGGEAEKPGSSSKEKSPAAEDKVSGAKANKKAAANDRASPRKNKVSSPTKEDTDKKSSSAATKRGRKPMSSASPAKNKRSSQETMTPIRKNHNNNGNNDYDHAAGGEPGDGETSDNARGARRESSGRKPAASRGRGSGRTKVVSSGRASSLAPVGSSKSTSRGGRSGDTPSKKRQVKGAEDMMNEEGSGGRQQKRGRGEKRKALPRRGVVDGVSVGEEKDQDDHPNVVNDDDYNEGNNHYDDDDNEEEEAVEDDQQTMPRRSRKAEKEKNASSSGTKKKTKLQSKDKGKGKGESGVDEARLTVAGAGGEAKRRKVSEGSKRQKNADRGKNDLDNDGHDDDGVAQEYPEVDEDDDVIMEDARDSVFSDHDNDDDDDDDDDYMDDDAPDTELWTDDLEVGNGDEDDEEDFLSDRDEIEGEDEGEEGRRRRSRKRSSTGTAGEAKTDRSRKKASASRKSPGPKQRRQTSAKVKGGKAKAAGSKAKAKRVKAKKNFRWACCRCGQSFCGENGALYHVWRKVCDKRLATLRKLGQYWDGKAVVPLPPGGVQEDLGAFSPDYPSVDNPGEGLDKNTLKSYLKKMETKKDVVFTCDVCLKSFGTRPGWKYHTTNGVCALARIRQEKQEEKLHRKLLAQQEREKQKKKSGEAGAAARPAAPPSAEATSAEAASREPNPGGEGKKGPRKAAAAVAPNKIGRDARDDVGGGKGNPEDDDVFEPVVLSDDSSDGEGGTGKIGSLSWMAGRSPKGGRGLPIKPSEALITGLLTGRIGSSRMPRGLKPEEISSPQAWKAAMAAVAVEAAAGGRERLTLELEGQPDEVPNLPPKRTWRQVPAFRRWAYGGAAGDANPTVDASGEEVERALETPLWKVTTVHAWAARTEGGGGPMEGRKLPLPIELEVIGEDDWSASGRVSMSAKAAGKGASAAVETAAPRMQLAPLTSTAVSPSAGQETGGQAADGGTQDKKRKGGGKQQKSASASASLSASEESYLPPPEVFINVGASVWSIDSMVRPAPSAPASSPDAQKSSTTAGSKKEKGKSKQGRDGGAAAAAAGNGNSEVFVAVGTGPLRQTDDPIDEADMFVHPPNPASSLPLPLLGERVSRPGLLQVWRAKNNSFRPRRAQADPPVQRDGTVPSAPNGSGGSTQANCPEPSAEGVFEFVYGIAHDGGTVLKCQWAPEDILEVEDDPSCIGKGLENDGHFKEARSTARGGPGGSGAALGLLAAVFTDGSLRVYMCPNPEDVETAAAADPAQDACAPDHDSVDGRAGGEGLVLDGMEPVLHASLKRSELTCVDWSPHDPTLLLAGASDGCVSMWKISTSCTYSSEEARVGGVSDGKQKDGVSRKPRAFPWRQFACAPIGLYEPVQAVIRAVAWCPESPELFATTGAGHLLSVWETSNSFEPVCCYPLRAARCGGGNLAWGPGRSGIWVAGTMRPFLLFIDFFEGGVRELLYRMNCLPRRGIGQSAMLAQGEKEDTFPYQDAVFGLDIVRQHPERPIGSLAQHIHLTAWTAPSGQVRVTSVGSRECSPGEQHPLAAGYVDRFGKRSKKSQQVDVKENMVMHRFEYVQRQPSGDRRRPDGATATAASSRGGASSESSGRAFMRAYVGSKSEGTRLIKWREGSSKLPGLLTVSHMTHIPATTGSPPTKEKAGRAGAPTTKVAAAAAAVASSMLPPRSTCLLFSGGHGGLVRCSVIPFRPSRKHRWRTGTKKAAVKAALERLGDGDKAATAAAHPSGSASTATSTSASKKGLSATAAREGVRKPAIGPVEADAPPAGGAASPAIVMSSQRTKSQHQDSRDTGIGVAAGTDGAAAGKKRSRSPAAGSRSSAKLGREAASTAPSATCPGPSDELTPTGSGEIRENKKRKTKKATSATSATLKRAEPTTSRDRNKAGGTDQGAGEMDAPSGTP